MLLGSVTEMQPFFDVPEAPGLNADHTMAPAATTTSTSPAVSRKRLARGLTGLAWGGVVSGMVKPV